MSTLTADEIRVLGVLVEKALTTPAQYPLSLNAVAVGCSQKNNRNPVQEFTEDRVYDALDKLKAKGLVREAMLSGSRVAKFRQVGLETLKVTMTELVVLAELMLRGPQTIGEIRGNASRMHPIESLESCQAVLDGLMRRGPEAGGLIAGPLVKEVAPPPGSRARLFAQLLSPDAHPVGAVVAEHVPRAGSSSPHTDIEALLARVAILEERLGRVEAQLRAIGGATGS
jgi:uncharacterized protein YceH (UPF0502 family)